MRDAGILIGISLLIAGAACFARLVGRLVSRADAAQQGRAPVRPLGSTPAAASDEGAIPEYIDDGEGDAELAEALRDLRSRETDPAPMRAIEWPPPPEETGNGERAVSGEIETKKGE